MEERRDGDAANGTFRRSSSTPASVASVSGGYSRRRFNTVSIVLTRNMWRVLLILLMAFTFDNSSAYLDVFITPQEVMKLLGLKAELYYVREGVVNTYALNFVVMIPANISDLFFSWQSLTKHPLPYTLSVTYDSEGAMLPPQMNISSTGIIPTSVQTFRVRLLCTGLKSAETEVQLLLNVSSASSNRYYNNTFLRFRRNKICLKGVRPPTETIRLDPDSLTSSTNSLYVAAACAVGMILLVVVTTSTICIKTKKLQVQEPHYMTAAYDCNQHVFVRLGGSTIGRTPSADSGSYATIASIHKSPPSPSPYATSDALRVSYYASSQVMLLSQLVLQDPRSSDAMERIQTLKVPVSNISLQQLTEEGTFGQIYKGKLHNQEDILIKTVSEVASKLQVNLFLAEGMMLYGMCHKNILPVIATNIENSKKPLLVYPFTNKGNLKRFLIKCRQRDEELYPLSTQNLVDIAIQIALGTMYLHAQLVCHKDLATRNCVIDDKLKVKITDSALSRDLFPNDYACLGDNENRPIKWLAFESLVHKQFGGASDVWSFGVVLWELTTLAQQPYEEVDSFEMALFLENNFRLQQPVGCPDELFAVMSCCWLQNPSERPNFAQLLAYLQDFYTALGKYI